MQKSIAAPAENNRIQSIDILRGLIMIIMALDHVRDFFSYTPYQPTDLTQASIPLFFTRWITHLCAPTFIFLSGISVFFYRGKVGSLKRTSLFLLTRGLWIILIEIVLISFILTQGYELTLLAIFWAIGCSMILLAGLIWLPRWAQVVIALILIAAHNAFLTVGMATTSQNLLIAFLHNSPFLINKPPILVAYTIVPWVGVMLLGYAIAPWFNTLAKTRNNYLLASAFFALLLFVFLRFSNIYGDPSPWVTQARGSVYTLLSFLNVSKSPPSLLFLSVTLGIACVLLVLINRIPASLQKFMMTYGRVPFFFFTIHLAVISFTAYLWTYFSFGKAVNLSFTSPKEWPAAYTPNLLRAYLVWIALIILLYYPCRWFGNFKARNKAWWVSYL